MLDHITQNVWIEAGILNCNAIDAPHKSFREAIKNHNPNASSFLKQIERMVQKKLDTLNGDLEKLIG